MKVEIEFPAAFEESNKPQPIPLGRLILGDSVFRVMFYPDGKVHIWGPKTASEYVHFWEPPNEDTLYGFS